MAIDFSNQTKPQNTDLEFRLDDLEAVVVTLVNNEFIKFVSNESAPHGVSCTPEVPSIISADNVASPVLLASATAATVVSLSLPPKFAYKLSGIVWYQNPSGGTQVINYVQQGISTVSATMPASMLDYSQDFQNRILTLKISQWVPERIVDCTAESLPKSVYLISQAGFGSGSGALEVFGRLVATRIY